MAGPARLACPTCQRPVLWNDDYPFRPFCSERCRLVDLGAWVSGERAIPGEPVEPGEAGLPGDDAAGGLPSAGRRGLN